jgi:hypothetical protein
MQPLDGFFRPARSILPTYKAVLWGVKEPANFFYHFSKANTLAGQKHLFKVRHPSPSPAIYRG